MFDVFECQASGEPFVAKRYPPANTRMAVNYITCLFPVEKWLRCTHRKSLAVLSTMIQ
jgi:hypothetical protein